MFGPQRARTFPFVMRNDAMGSRGRRAPAAMAGLATTLALAAAVVIDPSGAVAIALLAPAAAGPERRAEAGAGDGDANRRSQRRDAGGPS